MRFLRIKFVEVLKLLTHVEYRSRLLSLIMLGGLTIVTMFTYQNCSDVKFAVNDDDGPGPLCPNPPCIACDFSSAAIQTEPLSGYQLNQAIRFIVDDSFYTSITWKFYNDINDDGNPDPSELISGTPADQAPLVTFTQFSTYIAVAELDKDTTPTVAGDTPCSTTLTKFIPIQQSPQCEPVGINGPSIAFVGDVQTFSLAKPPCFVGTVSWDLDRPRSGSGTFVNEFNTISADLPVTFTYTANHARNNNGEYRVRAGVIRTPDIYEFLKNVDVRFKTCSHAGVEIPGDGPLSIFEAFASSAATCTVACTSRQFRCDNGLIIPVGHTEPLSNYPYATCTPNTGSCTGGTCGNVGSFYNRPANTTLCSSGSVTSFSPMTQPAGNPIQSASATWVCDGATGTDPSCSGVWCHQQQILVNGSCLTCPVGANPNSTHTSCDCPSGSTYNPTTNTCVVAPPQSPTFGCTPSVVNCGQTLTCWAHSTDPVELQGCNEYASPQCRQRLTVDPGFSHQWVRTPGANPQYTFSFPNNSTTHNVPDDATNLFYVKDSLGQISNKIGIVVKGCAAPVPQIIFSKNLNGSHEENFNYNADNLFGRVLNASANVRGCTSADIDDPTHGAQSLTACDGDSNQSPWVQLSSVYFSPGNPQWTYASGVWRYNGRSALTSNNRLYGHQSYLPGRYKSCVQDVVGPRVCVEYTVTANAPTFVISKSANGAEATSFNYLTDSIYMKTESLVPTFTITQGTNTTTVQTSATTKACATSPNTPSDYCDVDPAFSTRYVKMSDNVEWSCSSGRCDFLGLRMPGGGPFTHALNGPNIWINGNYKSCIYNQFANKKTCKPYSITGMP